jgi:putative ABC transport system permease protein
MWKPTIRGLLARKVRLVLTATAVLIGVSFVSATYVLTDTVKRSFDAVFEETLSRVDLQVQGARPLGSGEPPRIAASVGDDVRAVMGVAAAEPLVSGSAQFVGRDGETIGGGGPPTLGASWLDDGPFRLVDDGESRPPRRAGEVAMDAATAADHGYSVGDRIRVVLNGPARDFRIVGLFGFGDSFDFGAVTYAAFDLETAQEAFDARGAIDRILVRRHADVSTSVLKERLTRELGSGYEVLTTAEAAAQVGETVRDVLGFFTFALLGFAAIGVVVGAFVIFNTFTILVTQRTRELGLLRAVGASSGQVVASVLLEALLVGIVASVLGLVAGVVLGVGLLELLRALGLELPETSTVVSGRTVAVSLVVGVVVTGVASLLPALRAARVPPMAAVNSVGARTDGPMGRRAFAGVAVCVTGLVVTVIGLARSGSVSGILEQVEVVAVGAFIVLVGVVVLLATIARPVAGVIGRPLRAIGTSGVLARENAMRNPRRTAVTASALVIGLALVALTATFGASARASVRRDTGAGLRADLVVKADGFAPFTPEVAARVARLPAVAAAVPLRIADARVAGTVDTAGAVDPRMIERVVTLDFASGGADGLDAPGGGVLLDEVLAERSGLVVGDVVALQLARGVVDVPLRGTYRNDNFIGIFGQEVPIIVGPSLLDFAAGTGQDTVVFVDAEPGRTAAAAAQIDRALAGDFPNVELLTRDEFRDEQLDQVDQFLAVLIAILALSEIIAILGIVNTLALSVSERTHELGLLRTVGMSRRQLRRMVRWESVVIALIGAVVGLVVGLAWGWVFTRSLRSEGLSVFSVPVRELLVFLGFAVIAGIAAAVVPAWRASRLDVLDAISTP